MPNDAAGPVAYIVTPTAAVVEAVVDLASPGYHPLAKVAKDVAAGAVLLTALGAVLVGICIFAPHLLR